MASSSSEVRTIVLVGRTGNGKSATGNSILGRRAFKSFSSSTSVTATCEMHATTLPKDKQNLIVVDTPGLFDCSADPQFIGKEIAKCINLAKDGIHAILLVASIKTRISREEEEAGVLMLQAFFGFKLIDCMIVVFTGGDDLEDDETLDDYFDRNCPQHYKETLRLCGNRHVLFNNKTKDEAQKSEQGKQLLALVNAVVDKNDGKPCISPQFVELKKGATSEFFYDTPVAKGNSEENKLKMEEEFRKSYKEIMRLTETIGQKVTELKLKESSDKLAKQIVEQENDRLKEEILALSTQVKSNDEIITKMKLKLLESAHGRENENRRQQRPNQIVSFSPSTGVKTIVLVGKSGAGKSATGNSILGRKAFKSTFALFGTTKTCEMQKTQLENGQNLVVIDTPGLIGAYIGKEFTRCVDLANDGLDAIVLVVSIKLRFTSLDKGAVKSLRSFFGPKISDYMIVVYTHGDMLADDETVDEYMCSNSRGPLLKETLTLCENRRVIFDNKTKYKAQKSEQLEQLLVLIDAVAQKNGGKAYYKEAVC